MSIIQIESVHIASGKFAREFEKLKDAEAFKRKPDNGSVSILLLI